MPMHVDEAPEAICTLHAAPQARIERILVVVDPAAGTHACVEKAARIAMGSGASLELFVCDAQQDASAGEHDARAERYLAKLDAIAARLRTRGLAATVRCERHAPLAQGIALRVLRAAPDLIVKDRRRYAQLPDRGAAELTDWTLIRQLAAPLLLVRADPWPERPRIATSLDPCHPAERPQTLDEGLLALGAAMAGALRGTLEALHVLQSPPHLPGESVSVPTREAAHQRSRISVERLIARCNERGVPIPLHLAVGRVAQSILGFAAGHRVDVLAMGAAARPRAAQPAGGGTAAQVLESLACDLLVMKPPGFVSPLLVTDE
jgi:universal stress protein E